MIYQISTIEEQSKPRPEIEVTFLDSERQSKANKPKPAFDFEESFFQRPIPYMVPLTRWVE